MSKIGTAIVIGALVSAGCGILQPAAAVVNGSKIPQDQVEDELKAVSDDAGFRSLITQQGESVRGDFRRETLSALIQLTVVRQEASRRGLTPTDAEVKTEIKAQEKTAGGRDKLNETLADTKISAGRLRLLIERQLTVRKLQTDLTKGFEPQEDALRAYYEANAEQLQRVLVQFETAKTKKDAAALPRTFTQPATLIDPSALEPQVQSELAATETGSVSNPVEVGEEIRIYKVLEKQTLLYEEARSRVLTAVTDLQGEQAISKLVGDKLGMSKIVINPRYGRFDRKTLQVVAPND